VIARTIAAKVRLPFWCMLWLVARGVCDYPMAAIRERIQSAKSGYKTEHASEIAALCNVDDACGAYKTVRFN